MQRTTKVSEGQTLFDIAIQECGDINAVYDLADLNLKSITDTLAIGETIILPPVVAVPKVVEQFKAQYKKPVSDDTDDQDDIKGEGLEYWAIEIDFKIS